MTVTDLTPDTAKQREKLVIGILSGGLDSSVLSYFLKETYKPARIGLLTFDYGQRHKKEIECAKGIAYLLKAEFHHVINISDLQKLFVGSSLTDDIPIPHGHYEEESMKSTVVPGRNAIMCSIGWAAAACMGAEVVAMGVHSGDHHIYPDCRPTFFDSMKDALGWGTHDVLKTDLALCTPFIGMNKTEIVKLGDHLGVPMGRTWTCYEGGNVHCGKCGSCIERKEAFQLAEVPDPTKYAEEG